MSETDTDVDPQLLAKAREFIALIDAQIEMVRHQYPEAYAFFNAAVAINEDLRRERDELKEQLQKIGRKAFWASRV